MNNEGDSAHAEAGKNEKPCPNETIISDVFHPTDAVERKNNNTEKNHQNDIHHDSLHTTPQCASLFRIHVYKRCVKII